MAFHTASIFGEKIVIFGGFKNKDYQNEIYMYNTNTNVWEWIKYPESSKLPLPRISHSASIYKDFLYIFGGCGKNGQFFNDLWRFDFVKLIWEEITVEGESPKVFL
jgi:N-acetylneuraminic acid mutarotase